MATTTFEAFREATGWQRPGRDHGCPAVEVVPGVWTAHYHDIDSKEKLAQATRGAPIRLVVNSALCQCEARTGFYGPNVRVLEVPLEDDPDERKAFDAGKDGCQSACADPSVSPLKRCAGDIFPVFDSVNDEIDAVLKGGGAVLVHCHASLSRSAALILAYIMRQRRISLLAATKLTREKWDATWPCDRFGLALIEYEKRLAKPHHFSSSQLAVLLAAAAVAGATGEVAVPHHFSSSQLAVLLAAAAVEPKRDDCVLSL